MLFNINNYVRVKLTEAGSAYLIKQRSLLQQEFPNARFPDLEIQVDSDGYTEFQLYELMYEFGPFMSPEFPAMFDANIYISEKPLP
jgi:hypothetical protein